MDTVLTDYLTPAELASELRVCQRTLDRWNGLGEGPPRVIVGRRILYRRSSVTAWLASREQEAPRERRATGGAP
jgi:hypothetical protein